MFEMLESHEVANIFPLMTGEEFENLKNDIRENGLIEPIWTYQGRIIDGRNRYKACLEVGVQPKVREWGGNGSLVSFVVSMNLHRRHLSSGQKATAAFDALPMYESEARERQLATLRRGDETPVSQKIDSRDSNGGKAVAVAARDFGTNRQYIADVKAISEKAPELVEEIRSGLKTIPQIKREVRAREQIEVLKEAERTITEEKKISVESVCDIRLCSCRELFESGVRPDIVITDPPYPKEFIHTFSELAESCKKAAIPVVAVMVGQSYLPEVISRLCEHLRYRWTIAYLTPGGQAVQQWQAKANSAWKPVLIFGESLEWFGDVATSKPNDNDKRFHGWGQSESGMADLVSRLTKPGQLVCDPYLGGGTTAVVSLALSRRFVGCDIDQESVEIAKGRIYSQC